MSRFSDTEWARAIVALAIRTGIPFSTWISEDPAVITTALELIEEADKEV